MEIRMPIFNTEGPHGISALLFKHGSRRFYMSRPGESVKNYA